MSTDPHCQRCARPPLARQQRPDRCVLGPWPGCQQRPGATGRLRVASFVHDCGCAKPRFPARRRSRPDLRHPRPAAGGSRQVHVQAERQNGATIARHHCWTKAVRCWPDTPVGNWRLRWPGYMRLANQALQHHPTACRRPARYRRRRCFGTALLRRHTIPQRRESTGRPRRLPNRSLYWRQVAQPVGHGRRGSM